MPWAPFLEPSLVDTYVTRENVKLEVEPSPTLRLTTQVTTRPPHGGLDLGPD
jgi:hypothetical protein